MLAVEQIYLNQLFELTEAEGRKLDFQSKAGQNNPIANFALAWSFYQSEHIRLTGQAPEKSYFYSLHNRWYNLTRYSKRNSSQKKNAKTKGKGSFKAQIKAGQSDMFYVKPAEGGDENEITEFMTSDDLTDVPTDNFDYLDFAIAGD